MGLENSDSELSQIVLYPNPTEGKFKMSMNSVSENTVVELFNSSGKSVHKEKVNDPEMNVDLTSFPDGIYLLIYTEKAGCRMTKKIIKK